MIFKKTYHALERQYLRNMSDYDIKKTVQVGTKTYSKGRIRYTWGTMVVVLGRDGFIITCVKGDHPQTSTKILTNSLAQKILTRINS